ncbi:MAG: phosphatase PAP2 family protein [Lachnospiraceae bacterium]|nr:phosphatase PAP2 family protein [Lachnospiraceae bacterium]
MLDLLAAGGMDALYASDFYARIVDFDAAILFTIQESVRSGFLNVVFKTITHLGDGGVFWIILTLVLMIFPKTRKMGLCSAVSLLLSVIICNVILKNAFGRIRPYEVLDGLELLVKPAHDASFPSGHTSASVASAISLFLASDKKQKLFTVWGIVLAGLIGFSRIYIAIHYPTDVFVGAFLALLLAIAGTLIGTKLYEVLAVKFKAMKKAKEAQAAGGPAVKETMSGESENE